MRPPGAILAPGESLMATVFKFVEHPENNEKPVEQKSKVKFKIMCLKVKGPMEYVPELINAPRMEEQEMEIPPEGEWSVDMKIYGRALFTSFDEQKDQVAVEQILCVVFLDVDCPSPRMLAEAEAKLEARKRPPEDNGPNIIGEGLVIDEWKERREQYLALQQIEGVDSA
ncbi:hypothetical protein Ancab_033736 [Ancistrocladus abbreviatus]